MKILAGARPTTSTINQWWVLTGRVLAPTLRNGELLTPPAASVLFTIGLYLPLKQLMGNFTDGMSSYAQYLMPLIALQAIAFAAVSAAFRSATDAVLGINQRFGSMPIATLTPLASRMSASVVRCSTALAFAVLCGHVIGFRFYNSVGFTVAFCLLALLIGIGLSLLGDLVGASTKNPEATTHLLMLPMLIFGLLSVGVQPVEQFPGWVQPFVRNQPISQFIGALRALAGDSVPAAGAVRWSVIGPALGWVVGTIAIVVPLYAYRSSRRR
jgi:ABC-2 type transport system permease protein